MFSVFNVTELHNCLNTRIDTFKKLEETIHVYDVRHLSKTPHLISSSSFQFFCQTFKMSNSGYDVSASAAYAPVFMVHVLHIISLLTGRYF